MRSIDLPPAKNKARNARAGDKILSELKRRGAIACARRLETVQDPALLRREKKTPLAGSLPAESGIWGHAVNPSRGVHRARRSGNAEVAEVFCVGARAKNTLPM
jgi:hypothetical protein